MGKKLSIKIKIAPSVYPNPTNGWLYFKDVDFQSVDKLSLSRSYIHSSTLQSGALDLSDLTDGCYFIRVSGNGIKPIKILKYSK